MTCTGPGSDSKKAAAGSVAVAGGRMPVLRTPHSGSLQPAMIDGNAGEVEVVPPVVPPVPPPVLLPPVVPPVAPPLVPTNPPATLAAPTVTLPLACEPVMAPLTELEATSPPAMLASPACTSPVATDERIAPELLPT